MLRAVRNHILAALPEDDKQSLLQNATREELPPRHTFYSPGMPIRDIFFLEEGMASELVRMSDGRAVDVAPIGIEGLIGLPLFLGVSSNHHHSLMQVLGNGLRVPGSDALKSFNECRELRALVLSYAHARFLQATQSVACNLLHTIEQRLARWLMVAQFHTQKRSFGITQEFLAEMLGANRSTITLAIRAFEKSGLVNYERGLVEITNPAKLSTISCECNEIIAKAFSTVVTAKQTAEQKSANSKRPIEPSIGSRR
jgi:CRP-like cAMP-binding protein